MTDLQQAMEARGEHGQNNDVLRAEVKRLREDLEEAVELIAKTQHIYPTAYSKRSEHMGDVDAFLDRMKERGIYS